MNLIEKLLAENEALKSKEEEITSLKKLNKWYIEQLKLRQKEKFDVFSEKADENQMILFNEVEILRQRTASGAEPKDSGSCP